MTTQYSPILKLALPVQGELSGTWGDVVNDNITSMVEQAIAGRAVINTWTTNSHTLTSANGTTSESRCAMLELTDTGTALSGAGTVVCPTASKIYIVKNAAGQNITVTTSGGTGILVPNGRTTFLFCDGTNVVEAMTHTTSLQLGTSTTVTAVLDEDDMASNSATSLATQQSIKAYVDSKVGQFDSLSEVLAVGNTTGSNNIIVDNGQKITTNTIDETTAGSGVTIDSVLLKDDVVNATDVETGSISANDGTTAATIANSTGVVTVPSAVLTTADINGGTADGVVIGGTTPAAATVTTATANTSLTIAGTTTVTSILDEDNMASDDPAGLATQQSIKAYVDAQVGTVDTWSEVLANGNTSGATDAVITAGQKITTDTIDETTADAGVTIDSVLLKDDVVNATDIETSTISANDGTTAINIADSTGAVDIDTSLNVDGTVTADGLTVDGDGLFDGNTATVTVKSFQPKLILDDDSAGGAGSDKLIIQSVAAQTAGDYEFVINNDQTSSADQTAIKISGNGDISFYDSAGSSQSFYWDAADERLGINTTNPTRALHVNSGASNEVARFESTDTEALIELVDTTGSAQIRSRNDLRFYTNGGSTRAMDVDASGNVGIGVVPDNANLPTVISEYGIYSGNSQANITANTYYNSGWKYEDTNTATRYNQTNGIHYWYTAASGSADAAITWSEAMRIDSSNNLLVGTTSTILDSEENEEQGVDIRPEGFVKISRSGNHPLQLARTDAGELIKFRSNEGTVGSIGTLSGNVTIGTGDTGVQFNQDTNAVMPHNISTGANVDASIDLGYSSGGTNRRFKDLYLSNAVVQNGVKATTTATSQTAIETFAHASHDGAKVVITAATSADTYVTELLIATNGTTAVATEYGQIGTGSALATYDVDISGADVRILATPASTTSTTFRVAMTLT
jgi:hypothetical protein